MRSTKIITNENLQNSYTSFETKIQGVKKYLLSLHNPLAWPILFQIISDFNSICSNKSKFHA